MVDVVSQIITAHFPFLGKVRVPYHTTHQRSREMAEKSEIVSQKQYVKLRRWCSALVLNCTCLLRRSTYTTQFNAPHRIVFDEHLVPLHVLQKGRHRSRMASFEGIHKLWTINLNNNNYLTSRYLLRPYQRKYGKFILQSVFITFSTVSKIW